jgi:hypothetical protein
MEAILFLYAVPLLPVVKQRGRRYGDLFDKVKQGEILQFLHLQQVVAPIGRAFVVKAKADSA